MLKEEQRFEYALEDQHKAFDAFVEVNPDLEEHARYMFECPSAIDIFMNEAVLKVVERVKDGQREAAEFMIAYSRVAINCAFQQGRYKGYRQSK